MRARRWRKYDDYRIQQYCIKECPKCHIKSNGQAFCFGKFKKGEKYYNGAGVECTKIIDFCFGDEVKEVS